jgi:hypothetical protein
LSLEIQTERHLYTVTSAMLMTPTLTAPVLTNFLLQMNVPLDKHQSLLLTHLEKFLQAVAL